MSRQTEERRVKPSDLVPPVSVVSPPGTMGSSAVQITCVAIGVLGLIGAIVCCVVPRWKVSSFTGSNIVIAQVKRRNNTTQFTILSHKIEVYMTDVLLLLSLCRAIRKACG